MQEEESGEAAAARGPVPAPGDGLRRNAGGAARPARADAAARAPAQGALVRAGADVVTPLYCPCLSKGAPAPDEELAHTCSTNDARKSKTGR